MEEGKTRGGLRVPFPLLPASTTGLKGTVCYFQRYLQNYLSTRNVQELAAFQQRLPLTNPALDTQTIYTSWNQLHLQQCPLKDTFCSLLAICSPVSSTFCPCFQSLPRRAAPPAAAPLAHAASSAAGIWRKPAHIYSICVSEALGSSQTQRGSQALVVNTSQVCALGFAEFSLPDFCLSSFSSSGFLLVLSPLFFLLISSGTCEKGQQWVR